MLISETKRLSISGVEVHGLWDRANQRIIIWDKLLQRADHYCGTVLHECAHALTNASNESLAFETGLTELLGTVGYHVISENQH